MHLTPRERSLAALIGEGLCNKDIASRLGLSPDTVKVYMSRLFQKLRLGGRTELMVWARQNGFVPNVEVMDPEKIRVFLLNADLNADQEKSLLLALIDRQRLRNAGFESERVPYTDFSPDSPPLPKAA
jgi:DNA-binding CsgD family transcriptional regulator